MQPARILPDLQCSLLCEEVRQEVTGNFIIIGVINAVHVQQLPVTAFRLCVFNRWTAGVGNFVECVRLIAPDLTTVVRQVQVKFNLEQAVQSATNVSFFANVKFESQGIYYIEVLVDDVMKIRYPLPIVMVKPQPGKPGAPGAPAEPAPTENPPTDPAS